MLRIDKSKIKITYNNEIFFWEKKQTKKSAFLLGYS
jgi:hypothetical protein